MTIDTIIVIATWLLPLLIFLTILYLSWPTMLLIIRELPRRFQVATYFLLFLLILAASCRVERGRIRKCDRVVIDGDEVPGVGGTKDKPDTCIAYYDPIKRIIVWRYLK